jgi:hypothetical protein
MSIPNQVVLTGPFTEQDLHDIAQCLRTIERRQPDEIFALTMRSDFEPDLLQRIFPTLPGESPVITVRPILTPEQRAAIKTQVRDYYKDDKHGRTDADRVDG